MSLSEIKDGPTNHNLRQVAIVMKEPAPSKAASELAGQIQETIADLSLVLERIAVATKRGLDDSLGAASGGGEPVGGTKDYDQKMLDKLGGGGTKKDGTPQPIEMDDGIRKSLATLVASVGAARDWSKRAKLETFRLQPLSLDKAKKLLGDAPPQCINANCGRDVWCTPQDRYLTCRCEPCYKYWDRHDRKEERPKHLCDATNRVHMDKIRATSEN
jgi:hypothetical protein